MPPKSEFGLDYGPAPIDTQKAEEAFKKREQKTGQPAMTLAQIQAAAGQTTGGAEANNFVDRVQTQAQAPNSLKTPQDFVVELVVNRGKTVGEALGIVQELYDRNDPQILGMEGIDNFVNNIPSSAYMAAGRFMEGLSEPFRRLGAKVGIGATTEEIDLLKKTREELSPPSTMAEFAGAIPEMLYWGEIAAGAFPLAAKLTAGLAPKAARTISLLKEGGPVTKEMVSAAATGSRGARWAANALSFYAGTSGTRMLYGSDPLEALVPSEGDIAIGLGGYGLSKLFGRLGIGNGRAVAAGMNYLAKASGVPAEQITSRFQTMDAMLSALRRANAPAGLISRVIKEGKETFGSDFGRYVGRWAARTGQTLDDLEGLIKPIGKEDFVSAARGGYEQAFNAAAKVGERFGKKSVKIADSVEYLRQLGAPENYINGILTNETEFSTNAAQYFGRWAAKYGQDLDAVEGLTKQLGPKYYKIALDEYNNSLKEMGFGVSGIFRQEARGYLQPFERKVNVVERLVAGNPIESGGAKKYFAPLSRWHLTSQKVGPINIKPVGFENPLEVQFSEGQVPALAALSQMKGNPKLAAASLKVIDTWINRPTALGTSEVGNVIDGVTNQLAKKLGYGSIIYKGPTSDRDIFVDLASTSALELSAQKLIERLERSTQSAGKRAVGKNFLSIAAPVGIGLYALYDPEQANAMEVPESVIKKAARNFITLIAPTGEEFFTKAAGEIHRDIWERIVVERPDVIPESVKALTKPTYLGAYLGDAIKNGFVRAGRSGVGEWDRSTLGGPFVEFNWEHPIGRKNAINFLTSNYREGDYVALDMHNGGKLYSKMGIKDLDRALRYIEEGKIEKKGLVDSQGYTFRDFRALLPFAMGVGAATLLPDDANAAMFDAEPLVKAASKFKTIEEFAQTLPSRLGALIKQAAFFLEENKPANVVKDLVNIRNDVHQLKNVNIVPFDTGPDFVGVNVLHADLGPFPVARIHGPVDPDTGTWYPQIHESPLGFSKEALQKIKDQLNLQVPVAEGFTRLYRAESPTVGFHDVYGKGEGLGKYVSDKPGQYWTTAPEAAEFYKQTYGPDATIRTIDLPTSELEKYHTVEIDYKIPEQISKQLKARRLIQKIKNPASLAGILAATWLASEALDILSPAKAEAAEIPTEPIVKAFGKGIRGAGDDVLHDVARARTVEDLIQATWARISGVQSSVENNRLANVVDDFFQRADTLSGMSDEAKQAIGMLSTGEGYNAAMRFRPPWSASEEPFWQSMIGQFIRKKDKLLTGQTSTSKITKDQATEILSTIRKEHHSKLIDAMRGLQITAEGGYVQTVPGIDGELDAVARRMRSEIFDPLWKLNTGIDPKAYAILKDFHLEDNRSTWLKMDQIQKATKPEQLPLRLTVQERSAAQRMTGMLNIKPWSNLDIPYTDGFFPSTPIRNERKELLKLISDLSSTYGENPPPDQAARLKLLTDRLKQVDADVERLRNMSKPRMDILGRRQYFEAFDPTKGQIPKELAADIENKDVPAVIGSYIDGALSKAFFDEQLHYGKQVAQLFKKAGNGAMHDYVIDFLNTMRGVKSMREDLVIARAINAINKLLGRPGRVGVGDIRVAANRIMEASWISKLGFGLRFPLINLSQPLSTTAMVTGYGPLFRAYAKAINGFDDILAEVDAANVLKLKSGLHTDVGEGAPPWKLSDWLDKVPSWTENFNRIVTYQAAKDQALDELARTGTMKVPHFVRTFPREVLGTGDVDRIAKEYAAAVVRTTQFAMGPEGRGLALSGGAFRRIATQFKSFTLNYMDLLAGAIRHAKETGEIGPLVRGTTAILMLGGIGSAIPGWDTVRRQFLKRGIDIPSGSGLSYLADAAPAIFGQSDTAQAVQQALSVLQLGGSYNVLPPARSPEDLIGLVAGPTFGGAISTGFNLMGEQPAIKKAEFIGRQLSPAVMNLVEASQMLGYDPRGVYSKLGYRGGIYTPTGKLIARPQLPDILARAAGWQPSMRSQRYNYLQDIKAALEGGQEALARKYVQKAAEEGILITKKDLASLRGQITRSKNESIKPNEPLF